MKYVIETIGLTKQYDKQLCVDHLDMHVPQGKIYGLLGRNGAGKTTTMRMLLNLVKPTGGRILLFGIDYKTQPEKAYGKIGSIVEAPGFYENLTGKENLQLLARLRGQHHKDTVDNALEIVGLNTEFKKTFGNYSLGMKQRLGIAAAILHEPELLILDEPINGLDPIGIHEIRNFLLTLSREKNTTILLSSHVLSEIEQLADIIGVMDEGRLIEEADMEELHRRNRQYVEFCVSDRNKAAMILERAFKIKDYSSCGENTIRLYECPDRRGEINRCFSDNGLTITKININEEKLEDYFSSLIGGGGIG